VKIKTQLVLGIVSVIILSIATTAYVLVKDAEKLLLNEVEEKGRLIINYLAGVSAEPIIRKDEVTLLSYINKAAKTPPSIPLTRDLFLNPV